MPPQRKPLQMGPVYLIDPGHLDHQRIPHQQGKGELVYRYTIIVKVAPHVQVGAAMGGQGKTRDIGQITAAYAADRLALYRRVTRIGRQAGEQRYGYVVDFHRSPALKSPQVNYSSLF